MLTTHSSTAAPLVNRLAFVNLGLTVPILSWNETREWVEAAVDSGATSIWATDERDPVVLLAALSQLRGDLTLGLLGERMRDRPPVLAAKQLTVLEHLTEGRVLLAADDHSQVAGILSALQGPYRPPVRRSDGIEVLRLARPRRPPTEAQQDLRTALFLDVASVEEVTRNLSGDFDLVVVSDLTG